MDMTRQGDPSTPESLGAGYKAATVTMYGRAFHTFFPFVLVRDHRSSHSNVSQTLVRPCNGHTPLWCWRLSCSVLQCHEVLYGLRTPDNDGTSSRVGGYQEMTLHKGSVYRKNRCVAWIECLVAMTDLAWGFGYRHRAKTGSANLALRIPTAVYLRNAPGRAGSSKYQGYVECSKANRGLDLPAVSIPRSIVSG